VTRGAGASGVRALGWRIAVGALAAFMLVAGPAAAQGLAEGTRAQLRGLDRVSGVTTDLTVEVGSRVAYARLEIALLACRYPAGNPNAEAYAFLEITDTLRGERLFRGWMMASAPALNALDHPRHDVWVLGCR
jgi:hypothetical protein